MPHIWQVALCGHACSGKPKEFKGFLHNIIYKFLGIVRHGRVLSILMTMYCCAARTSVITAQYRVRAAGRDFAINSVKKAKPTFMHRPILPAVPLGTPDEARYD